MPIKKDTFQLSLSLSLRLTGEDEKFMKKNSPANHFSATFSGIEFSFTLIYVATLIRVYLFSDFNCTWKYPMRT
jgi:hypothetical protein